ncbi:MAG: GTP-dependent nucleic acid-binding protein EngD, partial [Parcubacteria group bacterium Gr01-1014_33]
EGEGLGNKFLSHIRDVDAIAEVVRIFDDPDITHVAGTPNPISDIEVLEYELILKDLETVSKRIESVERDIRGKKKGAEEELTFFKKSEAELKSGHLLSESLHDSLSGKHSHILENVGMLYQTSLLTIKPIIYIFNVSEEQTQNHWEPDEKLRVKVGVKPYAAISAKIESELSELSSDEKMEYLKTFGIQESGLDQLITIGYETLGLITYLTTGEDETRAWTIPKNSKAPRAGRAIHSDFEEKFIRAEVINWQKLVEAGSYACARELGLLRTEGREYVVEDGDVIEFRI